MGELWPTRNADVAPLAGLRIVDFGQYIAGPLVAMMLADQGADVIRVDPPGGPRWRHPANAALLRNRRVVELDLRSADDRLRAHKLIGSADVVIENFRPGVADELGIGAAACRSFAPQLIHCSLPGFGSDDPRASEAAWEGIVMAAGGAYSFELTGALAAVGAGGAPAEFSALPLASVFAACEAAVAVIAALLARQRDGVGQNIEAPLFDALFEASGVRAMSMEHNTLELTDFGNGFYRCSDGRWVTFVAMWFRHLTWFVEAAGCRAWLDEGLVDYERLWSDPSAVAELRSRLVALFATRAAADWEDLARQSGCSLAMLRSTEEWLAEPHATASRALVDVVDGQLGRLRVIGRAVEVAGHIGPVGTRPTAPDAALLAAIDAAWAPHAEPATRTAAPSVGHSEASSDASGAPGPLAGIRVLDMSRVVAAPTAAKLFAQLGADVVKVDTDPSDGRASFREPALHEHLNRGKQTMIVDAKTAAGRGATAPSHCPR